MEVYKAMYCPCIHESGYVTISIHRTLKGAYKAIKAHKIEVFEEWLTGSKFGKKYWRSDHGQAWHITKVELVD